MSSEKAERKNSHFSPQLDHKLLNEEMLLFIPWDRVKLHNLFIKCMNGYCEKFLLQRIFKLKAKQAIL